MEALDTVSLRVAFALLACCMLGLFYLVSYRGTRSPFAGWWCVSLATFMVGVAMYLFNDTWHQRWANPAGNVLSILGVACVWAGARSLRRSSPPWSWLLPAPLVVGVISALDSPATDRWAGGEAFLLGMGVFLALAAAELGLLRHHAAAPRGGGDTYLNVVLALGVASGAAGIFYLCRLVGFILDGSDGLVFTTVFGSEVTTLVTIVLLGVVTFSMSSLSTAQYTAVLRVRASHDALTGLLNRHEFLRLVEPHLPGRSGGQGGSLVLADLDHFKAVNDLYGHTAGDRVLEAFARALTGSVRAADLVGRYGGEEFVVFLPGTPPDRADDITHEISRRLAAEPTGVPTPVTSSFGIANLQDHRTLEAAIDAADIALYRAKALGRDRTVRYDEMRRLSATREVADGPGAEVTRLHG